MAASTTPSMLTLSSPAKINLFLRILKRRPDGYHELASLFQAIDLCDTLHFSLAPQEQLTCTDPLIPLDNSNLILKAAALFRRKTNLDVNAAIHLEKRIPIQAGLGGGSSNAATTLWAFNELCGRPASIEQLMQWSCEIGSDVTFFLSRGSAYCTGRGEIIHPLSPLPKRHLHIVKPVEGLSTPQIYGKLDVSKLQPRDPQTALEQLLNGQPAYFNDLELPAFATLPQLAALKESLLACGFSNVLMSGSGSAFFCIGSKKEAQKELEALNNEKGLQCFAASFMNRAQDSWYH